ncbi:hypothetical protein SBRCBS47491_009876 [Sporothrix bragantina]|uniref:Uncharacterized protein n=1 Tax=Sporothrix bragantina TaxID=671064 RepID=A0ABP0CYC8_9PEZI
MLSLSQQLLRPPTYVEACPSVYTSQEEEEEEEEEEDGNYGDPFDPDRTPLDGRPPIPVLDVVRGYKCGLCAYRAKARDNIVRHWRDVYNGLAYEPQVTPVRLQSWIKGLNTRYWINLVNRLAAGDTADLITRITTLAGVAGWPELFRGKSLPAILVAAQGAVLPVKDKPWQVRHDQAAGAANTPDDIQSMVYLAASFNRVFTGRVFSIPQDETLRRYGSYGKRFLAYCYRAYRLGRTNAEASLAARWTDE